MQHDIWTFPGTALHAIDTDLTGYAVEATDGGIGKIDKHSAEAGRYHLVVDTGPWILGRQVVIPAGVVTTVDRETETVFVGCTKEQIENAPEFVPSASDEDGRHRMTFTDYYLAFFR
ncbi:PRC-barrel domain containing protein [Streptomyces sp. NPDC086147]|uniref:PRC-barrel domain containing protein n=1 Tax=Streptomyces sp. NPDC086147 TaxID=3155295 RepID=UPI00344E7DC0